MPPDNRHHHDHRQGWTPVSGNSSWSWSWANSLRIPGNGLVEVQAQVQVDEQWVVHHGRGHMGRDRGGHRSRDLIHPLPTPAPAPRRTLAPSPVDSPVVPGVTTVGAMCFRNLLRKRSDSRPKILFYNKHEPHYGFTNFSPHSVLYRGKRYPTSEHLFQSLKVRVWLLLCFCFCLLSCGSLPRQFVHKPHLMEHIRTCDPRPSVAFAEARRFAHDVHPDWKRDNIEAVGPPRPCRTPRRC
jgi:hypothetical protein